MNAGRLDRRNAGFLLTCALVLAGGLGIAALSPVHEPDAELVEAASDTQRHFDAAVLLLHARRFDDARVVLLRVIALEPSLPEAHANLGFALLGLAQPQAARVAFERAIALRPGQANAYYGLALAQESLGDLELALGAMRSYLHLGRVESEDHQRRARAALWEWEAKLAERRQAGSTSSFPVPGSDSRSWGSATR
jgi:tetratricopeptide (TPR) repeat protein